MNFRCKCTKKGKKSQLVVRNFFEERCSKLQMMNQKVQNQLKYILEDKVIGFSVLLHEGLERTFTNAIDTKVSCVIFILISIIKNFIVNERFSFLLGRNFHFPKNIRLLK